MKRVIISTSAIMLATGGMAQQKSPNILLAIADDISYPYMSAYGTNGLSTPAFDEVARRGVLFENGYVTSPGSSPSRASLLTGKHTWEIEEAGTHGSDFPSKFVTYTDLLSEAGYHVGYTGKGWSPGDWSSFRELNPAGKEYNKIKNTPPFTGMHSFDYFENFKAFMELRDTDEPFCFWYGGKEAHRGYEKDSWKRAGVDPNAIDMPPFLPDTPTTRGDVADFIVEVEWFDSHLGKMLRYLEECGELDNTLIIVTADNGMPFPNAKASGYDLGTHVPMAMCWGNELKPQKKAIKEVVSSIDFAATFLEIAGVDNDTTRAMTSKSLLPWIKGERGAELPNRAFYARERHASSRINEWGYPVRALRRGDYLYLYNFEPDRHPAGDPYSYILKDGVVTAVTSYSDIDGSPSKGELIAKRDEPNIAQYFHLAVDKRPNEMLFNLAKDPQCMVNLANNSKFEKQRKSMNQELFETLTSTGDTRLSTPEVWDNYPYHGQKRNYDKSKASE
ncbi:MAG: sulfatase [Rikenellaceae bacterium]